MPLLRSTFPDQVWAALKAWAKSVAQGAQTPSPDECTARVEQIARDIAGLPNMLRPDVVAFYSAETAEMITRFRSDLALATDSSAG